jgi:hypothetical protein
MFKTLTDHIAKHPIRSATSRLPHVEERAGGLWIGDTPAVEQNSRGRVACPGGCKGGHVHGVAADPVTHRVAHCRNGSRDYFVLRPVPALIGRRKWWLRDNSGPLNNLHNGAV